MRHWVTLLKRATFRQRRPADILENPPLPPATLEEKLAAPSNYNIESVKRKRGPNKGQES